MLASMRLEGVSRVEQRLDMVLAPERDGLKVREVCALYGVSRDTFYRWRDRYEAEGIAGLEDRSSRPARSPGRINPAIEHHIIELRTSHPRWGPRRIRAELRRRGNEHPPARSTIERVMHRNGLMVDAPPVPARKPLRRFVRSQPNELWQTDVLDWPLPDGTMTHIYTFLDDHSRLCVAVRSYRDETAANAIDLFDTACGAHGVPHSVLSDRGPIFTGLTFGCVGAFERHLWRRAVCTLNGRAYHPQTQGKIERYHRTLIEWLTDHPAHNLAALNRTLARFRDHYNHDRPHQALDDDTPAAVWAATTKASPDREGTATRRQRETIRSTSNNGNFGYGEWTIALGRNWMSTKVRIVDNGDHINCYAADGTLIRRVDPDPNRHYLGTGKPRGRPPRHLP
jgi:transposase InsO family protein